MAGKIIFTESAPAPVGPYSQAMKAGDFVYCSGQIPMNPATGKLEIGDVDRETELVLDNMKAVIEASGAKMTDIVKVNIFLKSMGDFGVMNGVYGRYFEANPPARACVEVAGLPLGVNVEIECIAYVGK